MDIEEELYSRKKDRTGIITKIIGSVVFRIVVIAAMAIVVIYGVKVAYNYGYELFTQEAVDSAPGKDVKVLITEGMSKDDVATLLFHKGLINDTTKFRILLSVFTSSSYDVCPGEYILNTSMTPRELIDEITGAIEATEAQPEHLGLYDEDTQ